MLQLRAVVVERGVEESSDAADRRMRKDSALSVIAVSK